MTKYFLNFIWAGILLLCTHQLYAQTVVSGIVVDQNQQPVSFANVFFKNSSVGTTTSENGTFFIESDKDFSTLIVSLIGYGEKRITLNQKINKNLRITLSEGEELSEVTIVAKPKKALKKKDNPAYAILQKIWKNKNSFLLSDKDTYHYFKNEIMEVGMTNVDTTYSSILFGKEAASLQAALNRSHGDKYHLPLFMNYKKELISNKNGIKKDTILEQNSLGVMNKNFELERISLAIKKFDIYDNTLMILDKPFVSPVSEFGYGTYLYVLSDTLYENDKKLYKIHFFPRVDEDIALQGSFTVYDSLFVLKDIEMFTLEKANINFVKSLMFKKEFEPVGTRIALKKDYYEAEFTLSDEGENLGLYLKNWIVYSDFSKDKPAISQTKTSLSDIYGSKITDTRNIIERVGNNKRVQLLSNTVSAAGSGFIDLNSYLQLGAFWETFGRNNIEGFRTKIGFRSFTSTEDRFRTYFYGAFGSQDRKFKYGVSAMYLLTQKPRIVVGGSYQDDIFQLGGASDFQEVSSLRMRIKSISLFSRGDNYFMTHSKKITGLIDFAIKDNLHLAWVNIHQRMTSPNQERFSIAYRNRDRISHNLTDLNSMLSLIYTPRRNVLGKGVEQRYGQNLFSTFALSLTQGIKWAGSDFSYTKLQASVIQPIPVWGFGLLKTAFDAGKIFGQVPLSLLAPIPSNQTYSNTPRVFSLLDYYDFVTDTYLAGHFEHHFNGYVFNKIPWVKKTQLRLLLLGRFAYGTISEKMREINRSNIHYNAPNHLYWEYGFGLENIGFEEVRPLRVDFIWRSSFSDVNGNQSPNFGIRVGIYPEF